MALADSRAPCTPYVDAFRAGFQRSGDGAAPRPGNSRSRWTTRSRRAPRGSGRPGRSDGRSSGCSVGGRRASGGDWLDRRGGGARTAGPHDHPILTRNRPFLSFQGVNTDPEGTLEDRAPCHRLRQVAQEGLSARGRRLREDLSDALDSDVSPSLIREHSKYAGFEEYVVDHHIEEGKGKLSYKQGRLQRLSPWGHWMLLHEEQYWTAVCEGHLGRAVVCPARVRATGFRGVGPPREITGINRSPGPRTRRACLSFGIRASFAPILHRQP